MTFCNKKNCKNQAAQTNVVETRARHCTIVGAFTVFKGK